MKRVLSFMIVMLLCVNLACPVMAAGNTFVPSIGYKDGLDVIKAIMDGENVGSCIVITSVKQAEKKTTDITQDERDLLLEVYEALSDGSMTLPLKENYVIRDLFDINFKFDKCREQESHENDLGETKYEELDREEIDIEVTFDLGIAAGEDVVVMTYRDGEWKEIKSVVNNGDGTITCVFEHFCPVAISVKQSASTNPPKTGDTIGTDMGLWAGLMAGSVVALIALVVLRKKQKV